MYSSPTGPGNTDHSIAPSKPNEYVFGANCGAAWPEAGGLPNFFLQFMCKAV